MNINLAFIRIFFSILSIVLITLFMGATTSGIDFKYGLIGATLGLLFSGFLMLCDMLFRRYTLRSFNIVVLGLLFGYLMGYALLFLFNAILDISHLASTLSQDSLEIIKVCIFLFGTYLGAIMTLRSSDELYVSIPYVKFARTVDKKKDLVVDSSALADTRIIDLCSTGMLDHQLVIPRFIMKELYNTMESHHEGEKAKAKRSIESIQKLEEIVELDLKFSDTDFPEIKDPSGKITRLAKLLGANILTSDISKLQSAHLEEIKVINLHAISAAMKPMMQSGEMLKIKVQRAGKEPNQGVGYLEDGTMVVVNGGGDFIGELIEVHVLSVKHTSSGRMIFCNTKEKESESQNE